MKKVLITIFLLFMFLVLTGCAAKEIFLKEDSANPPNDKSSVKVEDETSNKPSNPSSNTNEDIDNEKTIDIENTIVLCKDGSQYLGKDLINNGINFKLIGGLIFYKAEELEKLCNPDMKEFDANAEPSFAIMPEYIK